MSEEITAEPAYTELLGRISEAYVAGQTRATQAVNAHITETYWQIGRDIVEFEQGGKARAEYGKNLVTKLSRDLTLRHGKGFSRSNVFRFKQFYLAYPKVAKPSQLLSWSHFVELLKLDDPLERGFVTFRKENNACTVTLSCRLPWGSVVRFLGRLNRLPCMLAGWSVESLGLLSFSASSQFLSRERVRTRIHSQ